MTTKTVAEYFADAPLSAQLCAQVLREMVVKTIPDVEEVLKYGIPFYMRQGMVCFINITKTTVQLGFPYGAELSDSFELFEGKDRKTVRHITIHSLESLDEQAETLRHYIVEAVIRNDAHKQSRRSAISRRGTKRITE